MAYTSNPRSVHAPRASRFSRRSAQRQWPWCAGPARLVGTERHNESLLLAACREGFIAFAPDLYHGKVATTIEDADSLSNMLDSQQAKADIADAVRFLSERAALGGSWLAVIGFSLGAYYALDLSVADPERIRAVVVFYGTRAGDYRPSKSTYLGHFAETDEYESEADVNTLEDALRKADRPATFYRYQRTGHWFFEPDRQGAYNEQAATLAWERTVTFLRESLPSESN
jgi:carboxymethylenebutenolidase